MFRPPPDIKTTPPPPCVKHPRVASWFETTLPTLLSNYKLEDIFNADKFGSAYQTKHFIQNPKNVQVVKIVK